MRHILKKSALVIALVGVCAAIGSTPRPSVAAMDAGEVSRALATFRLGPGNASPVVQHGTHLCSEHKHCGSGHLCCSGHCKAVQTCG